MEEERRLERPELAPEEAEVFARGLRVLNEARVPYLLGGAFAKHAYTGIWRNTKDLDLFLRPRDLRAALDALGATGFETEIEYRHWLAKAHARPHMIDLVFGLGNGWLHVDDRWFERPGETTIAGMQAPLIPIEVLIVSKAYIAERYRFDGADILHLIRYAAERIDWQRALDLLGDHRGLLLPYLLLFDYVYPGHAASLPHELMARLFEEARARWGHHEQQAAFHGTLLDPFSFIVDVNDGGHEDARVLEPLVDEQGNLL